VNHALTEGDDRAYKLNNDPDATRILDLFPHLTGDPHLLHLVHLKQDDQNQAVAPAAPLRLGVVFSGGQAAGGHNVLAGLFDFLQRRHPGSTFLGFLDGPRGVMEGRYKELTRSEIDRYRNLGGFHCLGSGRDKIEKSLDLARAAASCESLDLDGLVIVGGDDSNTNAAVLAEHFLSLGAKTRVVGVPKTLDGDLKNGDVSISFGFDTACKVYSELIGNIMIDAASARKYWHFVRLMGRAASHVTLECALQTHPQWAFISEEIAGSHTPISQVAAKVADLVQLRAAQGRKYGVILLPEGLVEYVPDVAALISELNEILFKQQAANGQQGQPLEQSAINAIAQQLTPASRTLFDSLSVGFQRQFLEDRDPHGNVQVHLFLNLPLNKHALCVFSN
jgi:diphosphate-dependent phosphofructokinase